MFSLRSAATRTHLLHNARGFCNTPAPQVARTTIIGRLTAAPEDVATSTGRSLVRYTLASESGPRDNRQVSFFRVASFVEGNVKELILGIPKGTLVHVEADTRLRLVEDTEGNKTPRLDLVHRSIDILSRPRTSSTSEEQSQSSGQE